MPVYANLHYVPRKKNFIPSQEQVLAWVDFLLEHDMMTFDPEKRSGGRRKQEGLFTRLKKAVLGDMPKKEEGVPATDLPPEPALYTDPTCGERVILTSRENLASRDELTLEKSDFYRIELPFLTPSFVAEKIRGLADFQRGWTLTCSEVFFPLVDEYENLQCGCRTCKEIFDPRDSMRDRVTIVCPKCESRFPFKEGKITPTLPLYRMAIGLEETKVVTAEEDDPARTGLNLEEYTTDFEKIFGVPFEYKVIYT